MSNAVKSPRFVPALLLDVGGTITFEAIEGAPTSPSIEIFDESGVSAATGTPTIAGQTLSYPVAADVVDALSDVYRARWSYTAGGVAYKRDQTFAVKKHVASHQLSEARLLREYFPALKGRLPPGLSNLGPMIESAWAELQNLIRARGHDPHRIMDTAPLEPVIAALAARRIVQNYSFGSAAGGDVFQQWAASADAAATSGLNDALSAINWYEDTEDLVADAGETNTNRNVIGLSR